MKSNVATLPVAPVSGSPTKLKQVFVAAMEFRAARPSLDLEAIKSAAQEEAASGVLRTDDIGLTSSMRVTCIQPAARILSEWVWVRADFETELQPFNRKIDALDVLEGEIQGLKRKHDETRDRIKQQHEAKDKYASVEQEYLRGEGLYNEYLPKEGNRPVKMPPWYYWPLLAVLGSVEFLINYEALYRAFGEIVGLAVGSALIVAIVIAAISHVHGTLLKQWRSWFGPDIEHSDRYWRAGLLAIATLGLACVLTFVA